MSGHKQSQGNTKKYSKKKSKRKEEKRENIDLCRMVLLYSRWKIASNIYTFFLPTKHQGIKFIFILLPNLNVNITFRIKSYVCNITSAAPQLSDCLTLSFSWHQPLTLFFFLTTKSLGFHDWLPYHEVV